MTEQSHCSDALVGKLNASNQHILKTHSFGDSLTVAAVDTYVVTSIVMELVWTTNPGTVLAV